MFRRLYEALARLLSPRPALSDADLARETRAPDPYVWRLPTPYDARWRRWAERSRVAGHHLPFPLEEACWQPPPRLQRPLWQADDDVVRPYVLKP